MRSDTGGVQVAIWQVQLVCARFRGGKKQNQSKKTLEIEQAKEYIQGRGTGHKCREMETRLFL
jgi:hypothetical protein